MNRRSSASTDDGGEASFQPESPNTEADTNLAGLKSRQSSARSKRPSSLNWNHSNGNDRHLSGHVVATAGLAQTSLSSSPSDMITIKRLSPTINAARRRGIWYISFLGFLAAAVGVILLCAILRSLVTHQIEPKGCRMSYMRPSYVHFSEFDTEHTRFATKYSLYLYREEGIDDDDKLNGIPVLFIPGNAGSYKQVRPIAAEAANYFHDHIRHDGVLIDSGVRSLDFFTVDFNEDITAFHGQTLLDQAEYLNEAVRYILSLYSEPQRASRDSHLPDPTSVIILGHSMGGVVARAMLVQSNYQANSINTIITMSAPHARPPVTFDGRIVQIYDEINDYWRRAYTQKWASNNPLWHVTLVSIAGGNLDTVVPSDYASIESLVPETHGFTVFTTGIPTVWTSMDHQAILWCDQFRKVVSQAMYEIVDVHRASQTKPRAERMRIFKKKFLTGMEANAERAISLGEASTLLTLDDESNIIVPAGSRLALSSLGTLPKPKAYLLPIPPQGSPGPKRFTLLTNTRLDARSESGHLEVLVCSVQPTVGNLVFSSIIDLSANSSTPTKLACKSVLSDLIHLPASTMDTQNPFYLEREQRIYPFSYLQYNLEHLSEHQFVAVVDRIGSPVQNFVVAEFGDQSDYERRNDISLTQLLTLGMSLKLPANRPLVVQVKVPSLKSALFAYNLLINHQHCHRERGLFEPLVRQYLERPYESKFFVNTKHADIGFHGEAPYVPPALVSSSGDGLTFSIWSDPTCDAPLEIKLSLDMFGSLGKLYMRYRTVLAAFPLLIVALVLRKQFGVYDATGTFISFPESLDRSLRQSIPLLILSLTLLSMSFGGVLAFWVGLFSNRTSLAPSPQIDFHRNDYLIGTEDPLFMFLVPVIGFVCIGICAVLHYTMLLLTQVLGIFYGVLSSSGMTNAGDGRPQISSPAFVPSTPRRRMISTAVLLFLVSTFIPYQFAYLVACLVQLFTVVRALRIHTNSPSTTNSNYYHYSHSVLLLMMWVLPINLPILAVWIRNLAVHWLTPFSSHHNVLSIMPFILLVENLTSGKMVRQVTNGLRHVTSGLLFGTALCAAVYGVSHAYIIHYLVNAVAAWLVVLHSTSGPWSLPNIGEMFEGNADEVRKGGKSP
ncbi:GPI inositol-deacylase [Cladobotryum mycophilum]|uniref:GPI inositol-deacylase n=1 Tax=Cladobotryum mycophilum TaxID=491253 RepID=A0ABR0T158_9HYPO